MPHLPNALMSVIWRARFVGAFLLALASLNACQLGGTNPPIPASSTSEPTEIASPTPNQSIFWQAWRSGPHADTYDLGKGPNTYCARCHAPFNWDPAAKIDSPPNCVSCKFSFESEPRIAQGNPLVAEEDWRSIGCEICHRMEDETAAAEVTWFNAMTGYHETVTTSTALCEKCHRDAEPYLHHKRDLGNSAHIDFVCTDCHDAHTAIASCAANGCHPGVIAEESPQHSAAHAGVTCVACHDAAGLAVGPVEGQAVWVTFRSIETPMGLTTAPYQSHDLQRAVDCERCHYPGNEWGIAESVVQAQP